MEAIDAIETLRAAVQSQPGLQLLVMYGSRARGDEHPLSDWDFGYVGDSTVDPDALLAVIVETLGTDRIDLADLTRVSVLMRFLTARDGRVVFERAPDLFTQFQIDALHDWTDMGPVLLGTLDTHAKP